MKIEYLLKRTVKIQLITLKGLECRHVWCREKASDSDLVI